MSKDLTELHNQSEFLAAGLMSGTSMDGVDARSAGLWPESIAPPMRAKVRKMWAGLGRTMATLLQGPWGSHQGARRERILGHMREREPNPLGSMELGDIRGFRRWAINPPFVTES